MIQDPIFYLLATPAVILLGLAKVGLAGVGSLALPLMVLAIDPVQAAAIMLPILIVQDIVSVWSFRHHLDWYVLGWTLPGATVGILIGYLVAASVSASAVMALVGTISLAFGAHRLWLGRHGTPAVGTKAPGLVGRRGVLFYQPNRACRLATVPGLGHAPPTCSRRADRHVGRVLGHHELD